MNRLLYGDGIVAGLNVAKMEGSGGLIGEEALSVQAGCAIDVYGREIVVPERITINLPVLNGYAALFDGISDTAYLGIAYEEEREDTAFAGLDNNEDRKFNKLRERYKLTIVDKSEYVRQNKNTFLDGLVRTTVLYDTPEITVTQYAPKFIEKGSGIAVWVEVDCKGSDSVEYEINYRLSIKNFKNSENNEKITHVNLGKIKAGDCTERRYTFFTDSDIWNSSDLELKGKAFDIEISTNDPSIKKSTVADKEFSIRSLDRSVATQHLKGYFQDVVEETANQKYGEGWVWIAKIGLYRSESRIGINKVTPAPFGQFVCNTRSLSSLQQLEQFYPSSSGSITKTNQETKTEYAVINEIPQYSNTYTGIEEMLINNHDFAANETYISRKIPYMLATGKPVKVHIGIEDETGAVLLGDKIDLKKGYRFSIGVRVLQDEGVFTVAIRSEEGRPLDKPLRIHWFATGTVLPEDTAYGEYEIDLSNIFIHQSFVYETNLISHTLGTESLVHVDVGVESISGSESERKNEIYFGDMTLFSDESEGRVYDDIKTTVKVIPEKGAFALLVWRNPKEQLRSDKLRIRWFAVRMRGEKLISAVKDKNITIKHGTITVGLGEKINLHDYITSKGNYQFRKVDESAGGTLDKVTGDYTAHIVEDTYVIKVEDMDAPDVYNHIYIFATSRNIEKDGNTR